MQNLALIVQVVLDMFERVDEQQTEDRRMTVGHGYTISPDAESLAQVSKKAAVSVHMYTLLSHSSVIMHHFCLHESGYYKNKPSRPPILIL